MEIHFYIVELDQNLRRNREEAAAVREYNNDPAKYRARIAEAQEEPEKKMIIAHTAKVKQLLDFGYNRSEIAERLNMNPYTVDFVISRIENEERERESDRIFAGWKRGNGGYYSICNGLPTRR